MQAANGWSIEELHTEEGRLDDVFRSITLSETAKSETAAAKAATPDTAKETTK